MDRVQQKIPLAIQFGDVGRPVTPNPWSPRMPFPGPDTQSSPWADDHNILEEQAQFDMLCPASPNPTNIHNFYVPEPPSPSYVTVDMRPPGNPYGLVYATQINHAPTQGLFHFTHKLATQRELHRQLLRELQQSSCVDPLSAHMHYSPPPTYPYGPAPPFHTHDPTPPSYTHGPAPPFHPYGPAPPYHTEGPARPFYSYAPPPPPIAHIYYSPVLPPCCFRPRPPCYSYVFCNGNLSPMRRPESFGGRAVSPGVDGLPTVFCQGTWNGSADENVLKWLACYDIEVQMFKDMQSRLTNDYLAYRGYYDERFFVRV